MRQSRCGSKKSDLLDANCTEEFILENTYENIRLMRDDNLRDFNPNVDSVQIKPQHLQMNLRKGRKQSVKMKYKPARNYPLDIYYLMDLTYTMKDDKETLVGMGESLSHSLSNLTENFRLGFGSFADKPAMPFIYPGLTENPCSLERDICQPTYGYKHKLKLTDDIKLFISKVNSSEITGNLDNLEG
jgi:integrin beta 1